MGRRWWRQSDEETDVSKLYDIQLVLLSTASQRESSSFLPLPATIAEAGESATKAIAALMKRGLAEERETSDVAAVLRADGDLRFGMFVTDAGTSAIEGSGSDTAPGPAPTAATGTSGQPARRSKTAAVIALLRLASAGNCRPKTYGGHRREVTRMLDQFECGLTRTPRPSPGMRLVRVAGSRSCGHRPR